jgi:GR25 family glycosyltransferase involved in LPS biosynthesis
MCAYERRTFLLWNGIIKDMKIDFSYIINLSRDYHSICQKFWKIPNHQDIPFFVMSAANGKKVSDLTEVLPFTWEIYQGWKTNEDLAWWNRNVTPGELGCAISHYWAWKAAYEDKVGNALFFEEDFSIQDWPTEDEWNAVPEDWDMVYLGRALVPGHEDQPVNEHIVRVGYSYNMHAYILSPEGLRKVLNTPFLTNIIPTDEFMPAVIGVHPREDVTKLFHLEDFNAYAFSRKNFVWQESNSLTSQTENVSNVRDVRDWDYWMSLYINPDFIIKDYESISKHSSTQGGVLQFPLFTKEFCFEALELMTFASNKIGKKSELQLRIPLNNIALDYVYHRVMREHVFPFLNWYWETQVRNVFACKSYAFKYEEGKRDLDIIPEHESVYCMALRLTDISLEEQGEYFVPSEAGNVIIHPTILTENYEGKKFVYDNSHCILSFF